MITIFYHLFRCIKTYLPAKNKHEIGSDTTTGTIRNKENIRRLKAEKKVWFLILCVLQCINKVFSITWACNKSSFMLSPMNSQRQLSPIVCKAWLPYYYYFCQNYYYIIIILSRLLSSLWHQNIYSSSLL